MTTKLPCKRDRGQVGIGTLIVFIAMVLVAAIAAGVLINTAGFLQSQSEQTGQQASSQVSDRLQVVNVVGEKIPAGNTRQIWVINLTVKKAPGAEDIDLNTTTLQFVSEDEIVDLTHASRSSDAQNATAVFNTTTIQDDDGSIADSLVINSQEDRAKVVLDIGQTGGGAASNNVTSLHANASEIGALDEGQEATVELTTQAGGETTVTLTVPDSLSGKSSVNL